MPNSKTSCTFAYSMNCVTWCSIVVNDINWKGKVQKIEDKPISWASPHFVTLILSRKLRHHLRMTLMLKYLVDHLHSCLADWEVFSWDLHTLTFESDHLWCSLAEDPIPTTRNPQELLSMNSNVPYWKWIIFFFHFSFLLRFCVFSLPHLTVIIVLQLGF